MTKEEAKSYYKKYKQNYDDAKQLEAKQQMILLHILLKG